jgi:hypothetical protein
LKTNKQWDGNSFDWLRPIFGVSFLAPSAEQVGCLDIPEGRLVTFPNLLFHKYHLIKLVDKTRSRHRKILTFLLVDPNIRVISSAIVPGQQFDWWVEEITMDGGCLDIFPYELRLEIVKHIPARSWERSGFDDEALRRDHLIICTGE